MKVQRAAAMKQPYRNGAGCLSLLAETINGLYTAEQIQRRARWKTCEAVKRATLEWVSWFNHHRLLGSIRHIPPAEAELNYCQQLERSAVTA